MPVSLFPSCQQLCAVMRQERNFFPINSLKNKAITCTSKRTDKSSYLTEFPFIMRDSISSKLLTMYLERPENNKQNMHNMIVVDKNQVIIGFFVSFLWNTFILDISNLKFCGLNSNNNVTLKKEVLFF